jgi:hypothetical protein
MSPNRSGHGRLSAPAFHSDSGDGAGRNGGTAAAAAAASVDSVVVDGDTATISGSASKLIAAVAAKKAGTDQVPSFFVCAFGHIGYGSFRAHR